MAAYSGTPLVTKLGIKTNHRVALQHPPADFDTTLGELPSGATCTNDLGDRRPFDVMVYFTKSRSDLQKCFARLARCLRPAGGLWIAWPKRASGMATDLTEDLIREIGLAAGLVDNKVCAVDETWSGLRFVIRLQDRPKQSK